MLCFLLVSSGWGSSSVVAHQKRLRSSFSELAAHVFLCVQRRRRRLAMSQK